VGLCHSWLGFETVSADFSMRLAGERKTMIVLLSINAIVLFSFLEMTGGGVGKDTIFSYTKCP